MNMRERFHRTMQFEEVDRVPWWELGILPATQEEWHQQGLPKDADWQDYLGLDRAERCPYRWTLCPPFEARVLKESAEYRIIQDSGGVIGRQLRGEGGSSRMPQWLRFPVESRQDWETLKVERLNPLTPERYPENWDALVRGWQKRSHVLYARGGSLFGRLRGWIGFERFLVLFHDDPDWVHEMMEYMTNFYLAVMHRLLDEVEVDYVYIFEDMSYKNGPMISPKMFREFMLPRYQRFTSFLRQHGVKWIFVDSDGDASLLLPLWLEGGINGFLPMEAAAGMDPRVVRKQYGRNLRLMGGLDKRALLESRAAIDQELDSKVPALVAEGGYIPHLDHNIPYDVTLEAYTYYRQRLNQITLRAGAQPDLTTRPQTIIS